MSRILIADDQALLRASLRSLVNGYDDCQVVGEAANGAQAVHMAAGLRPDLVLMDVRMPVLDGIEATRRITAADPGVRVLILTTFDLDEYVYEGLLAGASGFLLKDSPPADLVTAIEVIRSGEALLTPAATRRLITEFVRSRRTPNRATATAATTANAIAPPDPALDGLTAREREVLTLVARGKSNTEISTELFVSMSTVKTHMSALLAKLGARDRAQLVIRAYEGGLVRAG
ncbi:two component transcriptional regulator, LuxR family [Catenulispora acidiphila DSM 44928]|uniref:Two component transcriptional regulator, LuxR family n=1 Tax=Catenulispora acidiphila (strain DSM 44928 / JCM 14897 / NBRC 102108 / NRRL B-24433 / ID139908) TaxID=479433 RepID=C7QE79_CATAD|nr:response regulator transcription factor [Catenulispora acidiphila]ACU76667.1 two component transcriptional regulator, LuxR family [Catenulispora acidiphila DSM 44928]